MARLETKSAEAAALGIRVSISLGSQGTFHPNNLHTLSSQPRRRITELVARLELKSAEAAALEIRLESCFDLLNLITHL